MSANGKLLKHGIPIEAPKIRIDDETPNIEPNFGKC